MPKSTDELDIKHTEGKGRGQFYVGSDADEPEAAMMYHRRADGTSINIDHTEVSDALRNQGVGEALFHATIDWARAAGVHVAATCPFAVAMFERHEETHDLRVA